MKILPIVAVAALAGAASASTVDLTFLGAKSGGWESVHVAGIGNVKAGQLRHKIGSGPEFITFCTELTQYTPAAGSTNEYNIGPLSAAPVPGPAMGAARANAVSILYDVAGGVQLDSGAAQAAAAFQIAVWELVYDFDLGDGTFDLATINGKAITAETDTKALAANWLGQVASKFKLNSGSTPLAALTHSSLQDQIVVVPLPAPVMMGLLGLVAVAGVRRMRTR